MISSDMRLRTAFLLIVYRINAWKSLRVLDTIYDSILGRSGSLPAAINEHRLKRISQACGNLESPREVALQAIFDLCPLMDELEQKHCIQDVSSTENFLQRLQNWSKTLPQELRQNTEAVVSSSTTTDRELVVAGTHVACTYYFAVILSTRRFLTLYLLEQLKQRSSKRMGTSTPNSDDKASSLAFVCLNAAISISKVVHNAVIFEKVLNNMCLVKYDCSHI